MHCDSTTSQALIRRMLLCGPMLREFHHMGTPMSDSHHTPHAALSTHSISPSLWRNGDFLLLWLGQAVSLIGTQVSLLAFPLLILSLTNSPALTGGISALRTV